MRHGRSHMMIGCLARTITRVEGVLDTGRTETSSVRSQQQASEHDGGCGVRKASE